MDNLHARIKSTRKSTRIGLGLSQASLAEKTGVSQPTVANWETGSHVPRQAVLEKISEALGVSSIWLLSGTREANEIPSQIYLKTPIRHIPIFNWPETSTDISTAAPSGFLPFSSRQENLFGIIKPGEREAGYTVLICKPATSGNLRHGHYLIGTNDGIEQVKLADIDELSSGSVLGRIMAEMSFFP